MLSKGIFQVSEEAEGNAGSLAFIWGREAFSCSSLSGCTLEPMISAPLPECAEAELHQDGTLRRRHMESYQTSKGTHVPCPGRWILDHCTTREVQII